MNKDRNFKRKFKQRLTIICEKEKQSQIIKQIQNLLEREQLNDQYNAYLLNR